MSPKEIHRSVIIQVIEIQKMTMRCIHRRDLPFAVFVNEEIEALVMEAGESSSEKTRWIGSRSGNVVRACKSANHPVVRLKISADRNATIGGTLRTAPAQKSNIECSVNSPKRQHFIFRESDHLFDPAQWPTSRMGRRGVAVE